jgi:hypothetical protein
MTIAQLLALAGVISKDPNHVKYSDTIKYSMLTASQEALASSLHYSYLRQIVAKKAREAIVDPGSFTLETDFLRPAYIERDSDNVEVEFLDIQQKGKLQNTMEGGDDNRPRWIMYDDAGTVKAQILVTTYPFTGTEWYIKRPPVLASGQEPVIVGFDNLLILYFKHLFHLVEGQSELAAISLKSFQDIVNDYNERKRS